MLSERVGGWLKGQDDATAPGASVKRKMLHEGDTSFVKSCERLEKYMLVWQWQRGCWHLSRRVIEDSGGYLCCFCSLYTCHFQGVTLTLQYEELYENIIMWFVAVNLWLTFVPKYIKFFQSVAMLLVLLLVKLFVLPSYCMNWEMT